MRLLPAISDTGFGLAVLLSCSVETAFGQDLLVGSFRTDQVKRFNVPTGAFLGDFAAGHGLDGPVGVTFGPDGNLYAFSYYTRSVKRFNGVTGAYLDDFVPTDSGAIDSAEALLFGPDGNLYAGNSSSVPGNDGVRRYDGKTGAFMGIFASDGLDDSDGLAFGPDGHLYVSSYKTHQVKRFNGSTGAFIDNFASGSGLNGPVGLKFGPDGNLYVSSFNSNKILRFNGTTGVFMNEFVATGLNQPYDIAFGTDRNLYVADFGSSTVKRFHGQTGAFIDIVAQGSGLNGPAGLAFQLAPSLHIYIIGTYAGINIEGVTGRTYRVEYAASVVSSNWTTLTNIALPASPFLLLDAASQATSARFSRAVELP